MGTKRYTEEFRREAVELWRSSDRPRCQVAESLGISDGTLVAWTREFDQADAERDFTAAMSNLKWVFADVTEFKCVDGKLYLAGILDLHDRGLAGWSMSEGNNTDLVVNALVMALARRDPDGDLVHHADRGSPYTSLEFTNRLADWNVDASYGSTGDAFDNAAMESFWATLKREITSKCSTTGPATRADLTTEHPKRPTLHQQHELTITRVSRSGATPP